VSEAQGHLEYFQASFVVVPTGTGRSRGSWVWKYFSYHAAKDVSQCQVKIKDDDRKRIAKKFSSISETTSRYIMLTSSSLWKLRRRKYFKYLGKLLQEREARQIPSMAKERKRSSGML
jgi:1-aminocyclopropane-1-carboxylate deaminase/D-cysteine desulfhydrase-like pyridoxal-dependent ACC family enzyme